MATQQGFLLGVHVVVFSPPHDHMLYGPTAQRGCISHSVLGENQGRKSQWQHGDRGLGDMLIELHLNWRQWALDSTTAQGAQMRKKLRHW